MRSPHVSWVFAQLVTFPIFGPGATFGWPSPSSLTRVHLPQRGRRDLAFCKLLVVYQLGSPFGGAVAVRRLRGQPASASTQPMRGGRWHLALSVLANASPPPPRGEARLGFAQAFGSAHTWLPLGGRYVPVGRCPAAGLRCRVGRCWTSATGRQHPRRQPRRWHGGSRD